jgi:hypothetical protein
MRDSAHLDPRQVLWSPRTLALGLFCYALLFLFQAGLAVCLRINAATACGSSFHWWAIERVHRTRVLLNWKGYR